jgi:uncharacterized protein
MILRLPDFPHRPHVSRTRVVAVACAAAALILLGACTSSPPMRYYRIDALAEPASAAAQSPMILAVGRIVFPDYLRRPQQVRSGSGAEVTVDEFNRWAEPLDEAVPRVVAANVDALLPDVAVVQAERRTVRPDHRLFASVQRLDTDLHGNTELVVQWGVTGAEGEPLIAPRTSRYRARAAPADEPEAMAVAVSDVLAQFSRDIAAALSTPPGSSPR